MTKLTRSRVYSIDVKHIEDNRWDVLAHVLRLMCKRLPYKDQQRFHGNAGTFVADYGGRYVGGPEMGNTLNHTRVADISGFAKVAKPDKRIYLQRIGTNLVLV